MELLQKRLLIVVGKGGVGKTTCSAALALLAAKAGRKTLLVTVDPAKRLEDSLGVPVGFTETAIQPNLTAMMLDPEVVIREHLQREVPQAAVTEHPLFRYVTSYMPGLNELMAIGKLNDFRRANKYELIVVDTAPTGHALSFLSAPKAIAELMGERSLLKWAVRGYMVLQKLSAAARNVGNVFKRKDDKQEPLPDIDFERIFQGIQDEAERIQAFLSDPKDAALVVVTLPEKLPVEETVDLHDVLRDKLHMRVQTIVINKVQPAVHADPVAFQALLDDDKFLETALGYDAQLVRGLVDAARFHVVRRAMNLRHIDELHRRLPDLPCLTVGLMEEDVQGLRSLQQFGAALQASHDSQTA